MNSNFTLLLIMKLFSIFNICVNLCLNLFQFSSQDIEKYYAEICLNTEFGGPLKHPIKYKKDVMIYRTGEKNDSLDYELQKIITELNGLMETIQIDITNVKQDANVIVFYGNPDDFMEYRGDPSLS